PPSHDCEQSRTRDPVRRSAGVASEVNAPLPTNDRARCVARGSCSVVMLMACDRSYLSRTSFVNASRARACCSSASVAVCLWKVRPSLVVLLARMMRAQDRPTSALRYSAPAASLFRSACLVLVAVACSGNGAEDDQKGASATGGASGAAGTAGS